MEETSQTELKLLLEEEQLESDRDGKYVQEEEETPPLLL